MCCICLRTDRNKRVRVHAKTSRIQETLNLWKCADRSTNTKTEREGQKKKKKKERKKMCHMLRVTCHLSTTPSAIATKHLSASSPTMHTRLSWFTKTQKFEGKKNRMYTNPWNSKNPKMSRGMSILAIRSSTGSLQSTGKRGFKMWTDRQTYNRSRTSRLLD